MIKVDPDSYLYRRFEHLPEANWFGGRFSATTEVLGTHDCLAGGCWGISAAALGKLSGSNLLLDKILEDTELAYPRYSNVAFNKPGDTGRERDLIMREDVEVGWAMSQLGYVSVEWDEVYLVQNGWTYQDTQPYKYAVTHPVVSLP
jgi:hypothetical protein